MAMKLGARHTLSPDRAFGGFELRRLQWDTTHFGRKMGLLAIVSTDARQRQAQLAADLRLALSEAADDGYAHLIMRVPAEQLRVARIAEQCGLRLVDVAVDLVASVGSHRAMTAVGPNVRPVVAADVDALRAIAETAFEFSRFASDPFFSNDDVSGFYRQWVTNLCDGLAKAVLVAEASDEIAGFSTCAVQDDGSGRIPLIATSDAHRRQGVARALIDASLRWFASAGMRTARVKTQAANYPALALYHSAGFTVAAAELTYSTTLSAPSAISG